MATEPAHGTPARLTRRALMFDLGAAVAVVALAGCSGDAADTSTPSPSDGGSPTGAGAGTSGVGNTSDGGTPSDAGPASGTGLQWRRADGGAAGAYVLVRAGEATVVDTGLEGTALAIEMALGELGLAWGDVSNVVLTHRHPDHVGSLDAVAEAASAAVLSAGRGDIDAMPQPRPLVAVGTGDSVMGLEVIETPGHTPGHISVFDPTAAILVAGDAINGTDDGGVAGPNESFSEGIDLAWESAVTLAGLRPDVILFGHGPPATDAAADNLDELVADQPA